MTREMAKRLRVGDPLRWKDGAFDSVGEVTARKHNGIDIQWANDVEPTFHNFNDDYVISCIHRRKP